MVTLDLDWIFSKHSHSAFKRIQSEGSHVPYDVFLQVWFCIVEEVLHKPNQEDG